MAYSGAGEAAAARDRIRAKARTHLQSRYGSGVFDAREVVEEFTEKELNLDPDAEFAPIVQVEADRAVRSVMRERDHGLPRYSYVGGGYQRTSTLSAKTATRLADTAMSHIKGWMQRHHALLELRAAETGESIEELVQERLDAMGELEESLTG